MSRLRIAHVTTIDATLRFLLLNQMKAVRREGHDVAGVSRPGPWVSDLQATGLRHVAVTGLTRRWNPLADLRALVQLVAVFKRERFDLVHTHMPKSGVLGRLAARMAGVPIVVNTIHGAYGLEPGHRGRWFFTSMERLAARFSDFEFCQSQEILDLLMQQGVLKAPRAAYLGNGVDLEHFTPDAVSVAAVRRMRSELGISPEALVVGTVGRMVREKGYGEFIAAARLVRQARSDVHFIAVGPADESKRDALSIDDIAAAKAEGMRFLGMRTDMREILALMDIFVLASYREGFPRSALEAAAMARPLILTDIRGCREVVTHGRNGLLVPPRAVELLAEAILRLTNDEELRRRLGEESRLRAAREFDERGIHARILDIYRELSQRKLGEIRHSVGAQSAP